MLSRFTIRPYKASDEAALLGVWNDAMWADPMDALIWRGRYLLDPNFRPETCPVAIEAGTGALIGFVLGFTRDAGTDAWVVASV